MTAFVSIAVFFLGERRASGKTDTSCERRDGRARRMLGGLKEKGEKRRKKGRENSSGELNEEKKERRRERRRRDRKRAREGERSRAFTVITRRRGCIRAHCIGNDFAPN